MALVELCVNNGSQAQLWTSDGLDSWLSPYFQGVISNTLSQGMVA
jgi:hypothetical protein